MAARRVRALFYHPDTNPDVPTANVWVDLDAAAGTVTLLHDYGADLAPVVGWTVTADGKRYGVSGVSGLVLSVAEIGGAQ